MTSLISEKCKFRQRLHHFTQEHILLSLSRTIQFYLSKQKPYLTLTPNELPYWMIQKLSIFTPYDWEKRKELSIVDSNCPNKIDSFPNHINYVFLLSVFLHSASSYWKQLIEKVSTSRLFNIFSKCTFQYISGITSVITDTVFE